MRVLITGAFGNLGTMCIEKALSLGFELVCLDLDTPQNRKTAATFEPDPAIQAHFCDITNTESIKPLLKNIDAIIHNASILPPLSETNPLLSHRVNVEGTLALASAAANINTKIRFIFPSSVTVFGNPACTSNIKSCSDPIMASDEYTNHKVLCEEGLAGIDLDWTVLRVGVSVDSRTTATDLSTLKKLLAVKPENPMEWVHPKDVATAMCHAIQSPAASQKILLLGGGNSCQVTHHQFLNTALNACGLNLPPHLMGTNDYYTHWMDTKETEAILKFQNHTFNDYQTEMKQAMKWVRRLLTPIRPLANWGLAQFIQRLQRQA